MNSKNANERVFTNQNIFEHSFRVAAANVNESNNRKSTINAEIAACW